MKRLFLGIPISEEIKVTKIHLFVPIRGLKPTALRHSLTLMDFWNRKLRTKMRSYTQRNFLVYSPKGVNKVNMALSQRGNKYDKIKTKLSCFAFGS